MVSVIESSWKTTYIILQDKGEGITEGIKRKKKIRDVEVKKKAKIHKTAHLHHYIYINRPSS